MSRIKLLFAPENIGFADKIASALAAQGYDAANDDSPASAALVIWSPGAASSPTILSAARSALARRVLVPVALGKAPPPPSFEHLWPMDLSGWSGRDDDPRWRFVLDEIDLAIRRGVEIGAPAEAAPVKFAKPRANDIPTPASKSAPQPQSDSLTTPADFEDLFAVTPLYQASTGSRPGPRVPAAAIAGVVATFVALGAAAFVFGKTQAPVAASDLQRPPVVAFVQPKDQPADDADQSEALPPIRIETAPVEDVYAEEVASAAALRDPAVTIAPQENREIAQAPASEMEPQLPAAPTPLAEEQTIASLAETALRESDLDATAEAQGEAEGDADPIAELTWDATRGPPAPALAAVPADDASVGTYFRDCIDCPDMAEIRTGGASYALGVREITNAQWRACVADRACPPIAGGADNVPVSGASHVDAHAFVAWLSNKTGARYRLPSEREWDVGAEGSIGASPNSFGVYDTAAAAFEWTDECWVADGALAAADGTCGARVLKGSVRDAAPAGERRRDAGFRVARELN